METANFSKAMYQFQAFRRSVLDSDNSEMAIYQVLKSNWDFFRRRVDPREVRGDEEELLKEAQECFEHLWDKLMEESLTVPWMPKFEITEGEKENNLHKIDKDGWTYLIPQSRIDKLEFSSGGHIAGYSPEELATQRMCSILGRIEIYLHLSHESPLLGVEECLAKIENNDRSIDKHVYALALDSTLGYSRPGAENRYGFGGSPLFYFKNSDLRIYSPIEKEEYTKIQIDKLPLPNEVIIDHCWNLVVSDRDALSREILEKAGVSVSDRGFLKRYK